MELTEIAGEKRISGFLKTADDITSVHHLLDSFRSSYAAHITRCLEERMKGNLEYQTKVQAKQFLFTDEQLRRMGIVELQQFDNFQGLPVEGLPVYLDYPGYDIHAQMVSLTSTPKGTRYIVEILGIRKQILSR